MMYTIETSIGGNSIKVSAPSIDEVIRLQDAISDKIDPADEHDADLIDAGILQPVEDKD